MYIDVYITRAPENPLKYVISEVKCVKFRFSASFETDKFII